MSKANTDFGELRSLLQARDDDSRRRAWPRLTELFDEALGWGDPEVEHVWFPYAIDALERWPDRFRWAPKAWLRRLDAGEDLGLRMALVCALRLRRYEQPLLHAACEGRACEWVRHVDLFECVGEPESRLLSRRGLFPSMRSLVLTGTPLSPEQWSRIAFPPELTSLGLVECDLGEDEARVIFSEGDFASLEALDVSKNPRAGEGLRGLARAELPCLKRLDLNGSWSTREQLEALTRAPWWPGLERIRLERSPMAVRDILRLKGLSPRYVPDYIEALCHIDPWQIDRFCHAHGIDTQRDRAYRRRLAKELMKLNRADRIAELLEGSGLAPEVARESASLIQ